MEEADKVKEFLKEVNLSQYYDKFLEEGYDDLNQIISMADSSGELEGLMKDVGIFNKSGHRKRFAAAVQILSSKNEHEEPSKIATDPTRVECENDQDFQNVLSNWPKEVRDLWIPNPLTDQLEYQNQVLKDIFCSSYELMAPLQFKDYVISQRVTRWRIQREVDEVNEKVNNILNPESKDGNAKNVLHFSSHDIGKIKKGDLYKAESSNQCIQNIINTVSQTLKKIIALRANLFDKNRNVKSWRSNELKFFDAKKTSLETMADSLLRTQTSIITNLKLLKRKSDDTTEYEAETKRKKKRVQENKRKAEKEKESRLMAKVSEVLKLLTDGKVTLTDIEAGNETLGLWQLNQTCKLVPRFHSRAFDYLIQNGLFDEDAMTFVQHLSEQMKQKLKDAAERNRERKQSNTERSQQRTIFDCLLPKIDEHEKEISG